ncbi:MAG: hypothetical protein Q3996_00800 [Candidatus Saccharibacteria bacterium]|nr:hypothetical protein [Candidatus Saccharibacteria bacterium]
MKYSDVVEKDKVNQAIAEEMIETARAKRREQRFATLVGRVIKTIAIVAVLVWAIYIGWPFINGQVGRDQARTEIVDKVISALENYRTSHNTSLPQEKSRKQWQNEFVNNYLNNKEFMTNLIKKDNEPETYEVKVNYKKTNQEILDGKYGVIYIDQSTRCGDKNDASEVAGSSIASVRLKLESGKVYCKNNG